ncbi:MAG TPA: DUF692 domain-containing protein [Chromatiales bacterium]|nr:DUF692 domain-containing protein [Chromatiales bacterium]
MSAGPPVLQGAGLGLRRAFLEEAAERARGPGLEADFLELAPDNWIGVGGRQGRLLRALTERIPLVCHGLSLNLGGTAPLDEGFVRAVGRFMEAHGALLYSEHLAWCADDGQLYDLLPMPYTAEAVRHLAARIRRVQEILGRRIAVENVSCYAVPAQEMDEAEFVCAVAEEADCLLLLDVNNVHVNAVNFGFDPYAYIDRIPPARVAYLHVAGHYVERPDLLIDTHGTAVPDPVWGLLEHAYRRLGPVPTLLERDFNIPPLGELLGEVARVRALQARVAGARQAPHAGAGRG